MSRVKSGIPKGSETFRPWQRSGGEPGKLEKPERSGTRHNRMLRGHTETSNHIEPDMLFGRHRLYEMVGQVVDTSV